jgi:hypothetical protein
MTKLEVEIGMTLAQKVTLISDDQASRAGWKTAIERLVQCDIVRVQELVYSPLKPCFAPLWIHRPGAIFTYDMARQISAAAKERQFATPPRRLRTYQATNKAYAIWGDAARKHGNPFTLGHDHILTELLLKLDPGERSHWRNELTGVKGPPQLYVKVPDCAIIDDIGEIVRFHEAVSASYPLSRLMLLAEHANKTLAYRANSKQAGLYFW